MVVVVVVDKQMEEAEDVDRTVEVVQKGMEVEEQKGLVVVVDDTDVVAVQKDQVEVEVEGVQKVGVALENLVEEDQVGLDSSDASLG